MSDTEQELLRIRAELARSHQNLDCPECRAKYGDFNAFRKQACCPGRAELLRRERELTVTDLECRHCVNRKSTHPGGLCWHCYHTPGVKERYGWKPTDPT